MRGDIDILKLIYRRFNARDIDGVLAHLTADVTWANGMHGGHVQGLDAVRAYWTRQWAEVSPEVEPVAFEDGSDGSVRVSVRQSVRDLEGNPIEGQAHGLTDRMVEHVFRLRDGKVARFDIGDVAPA